MTSLPCSHYSVIEAGYNVKKIVSLLVVTLVLSACAQKDERAQQYLDGELEPGLTPAHSIESNAPRDYS